MKLDRTSMLYGTLLLTGTGIAGQFLGFVYRILLSRLIGAEIMGLYQLIMPVYSVLLSLTAVGLMFTFIYEPNIGFLNKVLEIFGLEGHSWLGDSKLAIFSITVSPL